MALWNERVTTPKRPKSILSSAEYLPDEVAAAARADLDLPPLAVVVRDLLEQHIALARLQPMERQQTTAGE